MSRTNSIRPLTAEQQALCVKWRSLACKYTLKALHGYGLQHFMDEADGLAAEALMGASRVWEPSRGAFPACLRYWVRSVVQGFRAHGARVVHQPTDSREFEPVYSLSARRSGNSAPTWEELLIDDSTDDAASHVDAQRLLRAAKSDLPRLVAGRNPRAKALRYARQSVEMWAARALGDDGVTLEQLARPLGVSRERVRVRVARVQAVFEKWAAEIRSEAA